MNREFTLNWITLFVCTALFIDKEKCAATISQGNFSTKYLFDDSNDYFRCTFEDGNNCRFSFKENPVSMRAYWQIYQGNESSTKIPDHTEKTLLGHYFGLNFEKFKVTSGSNYTYKLYSEGFHPSAQSCITFSYYMYGVHKNESLSLSIVNATGPSPPIWSTFSSIWTAFGGQWPFWHSRRITVPVQSTSQWGLMFEVKANNTNEGLIAIDDIIIEVDKTCPPNGFCDFERKDTCMWDGIPPSANGIGQDSKMSWAEMPVGWVSMNDYIIHLTDFEWIVHTPTSFPYPLYPNSDHTLGNRYGSYLLMKAEFPRKPGDRALLVSDQYDINGSPSFCVRLYYFIKNKNEQGSSRFELYQVEEKTSYKKIVQVIVTRSITDWTEFTITANVMSKQSTKIWFVLIGDVGSLDSAIAIDDISILPGECKSVPVTLQTSTITTTTVKQTTPIITRAITQSTLSPIYSTISPSSHLSCDFETGTLCSWQNTLGYWAVIYPAAYTKKNSISDLMPTRDHTLKSMRGHFAYMFHASEDTVPFNRAVMKIGDNEEAVSGGPVCFTLWYYMRTKGEVELNVTARALDNSETELIMRKKDHGDKWNKLQFETSIDKNSFIFEISALAKLGVVVIDDIRIENKSCNDIDQD